MILSGNNKPSHSEMNSDALEKSIRKEIDHGCTLPLTIGYLQNIKNTGFVSLLVTEKLSIN